ncbi:hypothetical protein BC628DRAFT_1142520 [Trametes gibbosa]|nr:hypothetical protein BC628DRAFT_1142520 [Trametes gibbosa]
MRYYDFGRSASIDFERPARRTRTVSASHRPRTPWQRRLTDLNHIAYVYGAMLRGSAPSRQRLPCIGVLNGNTGAIPERPTSTGDGPGTPLRSLILTNQVLYYQAWLAPRHSLDDARTSAWPIGISSIPPALSTLPHRDRTMPRPLLATPSLLCQSRIQYSSFRPVQGPAEFSSLALRRVAALAAPDLLVPPSPRRLGKILTTRQTAICAGQTGLIVLVAPGRTALTHVHGRTLGLILGRYVWGGSARTCLRQTHAGLIPGGLMPSSA